jgi:hypothetical protein
MSNTPTNPKTSTPRPLTILEHFKAQHGYDYYPESEQAPPEIEDDSWNTVRGKGKIKRGIRKNPGRGYEGHRGRGYDANRGRGYDTNRGRGYDGNRGRGYDTNRGRGYGSTRGRRLGLRARGRGSNFTEAGRPNRSRGRDWGPKNRGNSSSSSTGNSRTKPLALPPPYPSEDNTAGNHAPHGGARNKDYNAQQRSTQAKVTAWLKTKTDNNTNYPSGQPQNKPRRNSVHGFYNEHNQTILAQTDKLTSKSIPSIPTTNGKQDTNPANIANQKDTTQDTNSNDTAAGGNTPTNKVTPNTSGNDNKVLPMEITHQPATSE